MQKQIDRKSATKLLLVQWSRFQNVCIQLDGSVLFTGVNGSGKSTILDAVTYLLTGNTQFNKAAKDRDRTVLGYVRGDTKSNGAARYLRFGEVITYLAMEFEDPSVNQSLVVAVCIESPNEMARPNSSWFICPNTHLEEINFTKREGNVLYIMPKQELVVKGKRLKASDFLGRDRGTEQILRVLGLRCEAGKYRSKLLKMMAFNPENNIDQFIQESVLEPGKVDSLKELREQKKQFEHVKALYDGLRQGKMQLEEIEKKSEEYENKLRSLRIRELMLCYQEVREGEEEEKRRNREKSLLELQIAKLEQQQKELMQQQEAAQKRLRIAENNDLFRGMQESLDSLERQKESCDREGRQWKKELEKVQHLEQQLGELFACLEPSALPSERDKECLLHLSAREYSLTQKQSVWKQYGEVIQAQDEQYEYHKVHLQDAIAEAEKYGNELETKIKRLEANRLVFAEEAEKARRVIQQNLEKQGIHTDVLIFAELVQEITKPEWRAAIETFLGRKRFYLIVDAAYCRKAMEILEKARLHQANLVVTDKLPHTEVTEGSAAELLKIPNPFARRYANYLLNGIHLCESLEELHEHPKGGLMKNGMLAKSYAVTMLNLSKTEMCMGQEAVKWQLEQAKKAKKENAAVQKENRDKLAQILEQRKAIAKIDWEVAHYDFEAALRLEESQNQIKRLETDIQNIKVNPDFAAILQEQAAAAKQAEETNRAVNQNAGKIGASQAELQECERQQAELLRSMDGKQKLYTELCQKHMELRQPMLDEYERQRQRQKKADSWRVILPKSVDNLRSELKECERNLEDAQLQYCRVAETDINKRGVAYIPYYREEYRNLAHVKIEEAQQKLEEQAKKLESAFMNDFVAEIDEAVREARQEMEAINRELKRIPFGNDTYRFVMREKADRAIFFRICRRLEKYMNSPEVYMNQGRDDEEMEHDIQEFMGTILAEEDELEYTDYRKYFVYDMEIISRQGQREITADLSKKQGSASNGEKQTPYFIILAASLLQCYPRNTCCVRLAFIDEAFSALSRERIEQMVKYLEENHFQVFYAAPPEKINSIGSFISSTVSLVETGRYTTAVEGLVK